MTNTLKFKSNKLSSYAVLILLTCISITALSSFLFQNPKLRGGELSQLNKLFKPNQIQKITGIEFNNSVGSFSIKRQSNSSKWKINSPRSLSANDISIRKVLEFLGSINIKKVLNYDPINVSNYSLENPLVTINLLQGESDESLSIKFGMQNSIDKSVYLSIEQRDAIYNVTTKNFNLENLNFTEFIEARVLPYSPSQITRFEFSKKEAPPHLSAIKEKLIWKSKKKTLGENKTRELLEKLTSFKSIYIVDQQTKKQKRKIKRYLSKPNYKATITLDTREVEILVSESIASLPGITMEKWRNVIVKTSESDNYFIVSRKFATILKKTTKQLSDLSIKKIFY